MRRDGFTLIELAIVLIIIGLIIGAVLIGDTLIRSAQIRNAIAEYDAYLKAVKEFQDKYNALPGDMTGATTLWGTDPDGCPAAANATPKTATCDGDGGGTIGGSDVDASLSTTTEWWRAWQQLSDAGLITGKFTGAQGSGGAAEAVIGNNVPASSLYSAGWTINYLLLTSNTTYTGLWADQYGHMLNLGGFVSGSYTKGAVLTPAEAQQMDVKIDDGMPGTGKIRAWRTSVLAHCTNETVPYNSQSTAIYDTSYTDKECALVFLMGF